DMLGRCLDLHFICWGTTNSLMLPSIDEQEILEDELISQYASRVSPYMPVKPPLRIAETYDTATFLDDFLNSHLVGGNIQRFSIYIDELSALAKGKAGSAASIQGMVCIYIPAVAGRRAGYSQHRFIGLQHLERLLSHEPSITEYSKQQELQRKNEIKQDYGMSM
ncbi:hypothetical protein K5D56_26770, partial [Pseudomonas cichorii]|nr:hypothetical protein [Pseudomonas cichorii]